MIVIALIAALSMVAGGIIAIQISGGDGASTDAAGVVATTTTTGSGPATAGTQGGAPSDQPGEPPASSTGGEQTSDGASETPTGETQIFPDGKPLPTVLPAHQPVRSAPINGIQAVEAYYSDWKQVDNFVIAWRPGAFSEERR